MLLLDKARTDVKVHGVNMLIPEIEAVWPLAKQFLRHSIMYSSLVDI
jgi:hypothetical protein